MRTLVAMLVIARCAAAEGEGAPAPCFEVDAHTDSPTCLTNQDDCTDSPEVTGKCKASVLGQAPALMQKRYNLRQAALAAAEEKQQPIRQMTVLCWNLLYLNFNGGREQQRKELAHVMTHVMDADVAGLQECMNENLMQDALGDRLHKAPGTDVFNCIFYKPGVIQFGDVSGRQYLGETGRDAYSERYLSYAKLYYGGVEFWVFSTHWCLDHQCAGAAGGVRHKHSATVLLNLREELGAADKPTLITADCNSHMDGYDEDDGVQFLLAHGFKIAGKGPMAGGIDYIFVSEGHWEVEDHMVGPTAPSDHPSFLVKVTLNGAGPVVDPEPGHQSPNFYRWVDGVGGWGGTCTCPDGEIYQVGDNYNDCGTLACEGGSPSACEKIDVPRRSGMMVTCGDAPIEVPDNSGQDNQDDQSESGSPSENFYRKADQVGGWGGSCTCPDGQVYNVGDNYDSCGSLACEGGVPGECVREVDHSRDGMKVTCATVEATLPPVPETSILPEEQTSTVSPMPSSTPASAGTTGAVPDGSATSAPEESETTGSPTAGSTSSATQAASSTTASSTTTAPPESNTDAPTASTSAATQAASTSMQPETTPSATPADWYRKAVLPERVGGWGGWCTCPSGEKYNVGDLWDSCAHGPQSLACEGGTPGECIKAEDPERMGMKVTCGGFVETSTTTQTLPPMDFYRKVAGVGAWGGTCTCPSGRIYSVGDQNDSCGSLACEGGVPSACEKIVDHDRNGMMVTCGSESVVTG